MSLANSKQVSRTLIGKEVHARGPATDCAG